MASSLATVAYIFMKKYAEGAEDISQREHPLYARTPKRDGFVGTSFSYFIRYENPQGISDLITNAIANAASSKGKQIQMSRFSKHGVINIDIESMQACANKGAVVELVSMETEGVLTEIGADFAFDLYHSYGQRGRRASINGNVVTLTVADDARNFHEGMTVAADDTSTGVSPRSGTTTVVAIDEDAGTITLANAASITGFADNDYLFRDGASSTTAMEGLDICTPLTAPVYGSDSFRGIDRGSRPNLLAGSRLDDANLTTKEVIGRLAIKINNNKRKMTEAYLNPIKFWDVVRAEGGKIEYDGSGGGATYGFETFKIATPAGTITLVSDPDCPTNRVRGVNPAKHYIKTLEALPHIVNEDGLRVRLSATADEVQGRVRGRGNYAQSDPGCFAVGALY